MSTTRNLYEQVILDHNRSPRNFGELNGADLQVEGVNPLCGDSFTLFASFDGELLKAISFTGHGCAISKASASLMTTLVKGKTKDEAIRLFHLFHDMLKSDTDAALDEESLGKMLVFAGVREYPMRIKCAMLAWHALRELLDKSSAA